MSLWETFTLAVKNISGSKMRTFLTMLGIIIGVCAVIVIVGLGNGMAGYMEDSFAEMGTNTLTVSIVGPPAPCPRSRCIRSWRTTPAIWTRFRLLCP